MAANIQSSAHSQSRSQSQAELRAYLEERLRSQFPSANSHELNHAIEAAMGRHGYMLDHNEQGRGGQHERREQPRGGQSEHGQHHPHQHEIAQVRDAAISAAKSISDSSVRMAAIAAAWIGYAATCAHQDQGQQHQGQHSAHN